MSRRHASTIGLIRNLNTGSVTPQFHVVYDDLFTTLPSNVDPNQVEPPSNWDNLLMFSRRRHVEDDDEPPPLSDEWLDTGELKERKKQRAQRIQQRQNLMPTLHPIQPTLPSEREQEQQNADFDNAENIEDGLVPEGDEDHLDEPPDLVDHLNEDSDDKDEIDYN